MPQSRVPGFLLLILLWLGPAIAATCTRIVVAQAGDTCASLSVANALTVSQFIQLNPTISNCALLPGATYCVSDDPAATTSPPRTSSAPPGPASSLIPSPDGSDGICGNQYTCLGSVYGDCCSENGYCGNTTEYCGDGCNPVFGRCGGGIPAEPGDGTPITVTITEGPVTRTVTATITTKQTVTKVQTVTQTVAPARPSPTLDGTDVYCRTYYQWKVTDSCTRLARTLGVTLDQLYIWNPQLDCSQPPLGYYLCIGE